MKWTFVNTKFQFRAGNHIIHPEVTFWANDFAEAASLLSQLVDNPQDWSAR